MAELSIPARNALIKAEYARGVPTEETAERYGLTNSMIARIGSRLCGARNAPRAGKRTQIAIYVTPDEWRRAHAAATKRGLTASRLVARLARAALSDPALLDNVLDDGIQTGGGQ